MYNCKLSLSHLKYITIILEVAEAAAMVEDPHDNGQGAPHVKGRVGILFVENAAMLNSSSSRLWQGAPSVIIEESVLYYSRYVIQLHSA